ncbi:T9SS type A sorting domain-containing protein [Epilithonimonas sp.]|uniref:T9SS type A sorting domain-containing protein n=1 Tax=Epilithonimonas sp. TaxID=2894511 RepID=UPI002FDCB778
MKKILLSISFITVAFSSAQISLNEGFESGSTPTGFTNVSFFPSKVLTPCTGTYGLTRNFWSGGIAGSTTYSSTLSNGGKIDISFAYKTHIYSGGSVNGTLKAEYSIDGGQNYTALGTTINLNSLIACTTWSGSIPQNVVPSGANFKFRVSGQWTSGEYNVILDDFKLTQSPFLATSDIAKKEIPVYPNPFKDIIYLDNADAVKSVSIADVSGRNIKTVAVASKEIRLSELKKGIYILTIENKDGSYKQTKLIKD